MRGDQTDAVIPGEPISTQGSQKSPHLHLVFLPSSVPTATLPFGQTGFKANDYTNNAIGASNWKQCTSPTMPLQVLRWPTCSVVSSLLEATYVQTTVHILYFIYTMFPAHQQAVASQRLSYELTANWARANV